MSTTKFSKVWRNPDSRFDAWWAAAEARLATLTNPHAHAFMDEAIKTRDFVAKSQSETTISDLYHWAVQHHASGWVQNGDRAVLTEPIVQP
jgi:hypothetical protein